MNENPQETKPERKRGAQPGNRNALRHGLKAGQLSADCKYIQNRLNAFRRQIEDLVVAERKKVTLTDAANIQTALRWERHAALCHRWLTKSGASLKPTDCLNFSREIAKASTERDRALAALKLDRDRKDDLVAMYSRPLVIDVEAEDDRDD